MHPKCQHFLPIFENALGTERLFILFRQPALKTLEDIVLLCPIKGNLLVWTTFQSESEIAHLAASQVRF